MGAVLTTKIPENKEHKQLLDYKDKTRVIIQTVDIPFPR
jgi:hypothetical protein